MLLAQTYPDSFVIFVAAVAVVVVIGILSTLIWFVRGVFGLMGPGEKPEPEPPPVSLPVIQAPAPPEQTPSLTFAEPVVRPIELDDIEIGYKQALEVFGPVGRRDLVIAQEVWAKQRAGTAIFVAQVGEKIVGTATIHFDKKAYYDGRPAGFIEDVAVLPDFRRLKIGTKLIRACIEEARRRNAYKVILDSLKDAIPFYQKLGFYQPPLANMRMDLKADEGTPMEVTT